jgi:Protein of unknown function (DUF664)
MTEEYARHNGHADLLRERITGASASSTPRWRMKPLLQLTLRDRPELRRSAHRRVRSGRQLLIVTPKSGA